MKKINSKNLSPLYFLSALLPFIFVSLALSKDAVNIEALKPQIITVINPSSNYGIQIGDALNRTVVIQVPQPLQIANSDFPKKGKKDNGIELTAIHVEKEETKSQTIYKFNLLYQAFKTSATPIVMRLPAENFRISNAAKAGDKPLVLELPAWNFWFSPLVTGGIETAQSNIHPDIQPPLVSMGKFQSLLILFSTLLLGSLFAFLYINVDGQWLPFNSGAFAKAHRQIKRLSKQSTNKTARQEKQALVYIHEAFNHHYGANIFARDVEKFIAMRPTFKKMKSEIERFFNDSNQSLYTIETNNSAEVIEKLLSLSKQLRHCERGI